LFINLVGSIILPVSLELRHEAINLFSFIPMSIDEYHCIVVNPVRDQMSKFPFYFFTDLFLFSLSDPQHLPA